MERVAAEAIMRDNEFSVLFLGTGVSTAIPCLGHVLDRNENGEMCPVCAHALNVPNSKNRRNNVSISIVFRGNNGQKQCVMIDSGKTMRDACTRWFPEHGINEVTALFISHGHADAMLGLDDIRDLQRALPVHVVDPHHDDGRLTRGFQILSGPLPVYATETTLHTVRNAFAYLTSAAPCYLDEERCILERRIALLDVREIDEWARTEVHGLAVQCFPVYHGGKFISLGFSIGKAGEFVYISDVKIIPKQTWYYLKSLPQIKVLVLDALERHGIFSHCGLEEAIEFVKALNPQKVYFTGMACGMGLHDEAQAELTQRNESYFLAYDGLFLEGFQFD